MGVMMEKKGILKETYKSYVYENQKRGVWYDEETETDAGSDHHIHCPVRSPDGGGAYGGIGRNQYMDIICHLSGALPGHRI